MEAVGRSGGVFDLDFLLLCNSRDSLHFHLSFSQLIAGSSMGMGFDNMVLQGERLSNRNFD